jgi:hypothetical protein
MLSIVILNVFILSVVTLIVVMLSVIILNVASLNLFKIRTNRIEEQLAGSSQAPGLFCSEKEIQIRFWVPGLFINLPLCQSVFFVG